MTRAHSPRDSVIPPWIGKIDLYDIHSHIVYGVDDGAVTMADSTSFLNQYAALGYCGVVATPHVNHRLFQTPSLELINQKLTQLHPQMDEIGVQVKAGAEVMCRGDFLALFNDNRVGGVNDVYLVEFENRPMTFTPAMERMLFDFQRAGRTLVLAHPERYVDVQTRPECIDILKERGMLMQVNLGSLMGVSGSRARQLAWRFVESGIADMVSTDAHRLEDFQVVASALGELASFNIELFQRLASINPGHIFRGDGHLIV